MRGLVVCASVVPALLSSLPARAEIFLLKKEKADDWEVSTNGRVDAYLNWIGGETINADGLGNKVDPDDPASTDRYILVGPQISIRGNPTPVGAVGNTVTDTDLNTFRNEGVRQHGHRQHRRPAHAPRLPGSRELPRG
ncbi:hypothetical protein [Sorangium sp. So ce854]|uniref:hypothetical protein n=1 Tax=Sorangium sp. So ce854 TaxID=3133322 RepID=UPI003F644A04